MGTEKQRKKNLFIMLNTIQEAHEKGQTISKRKLSGLMGLELGLTRNKVLEYLETLEDAGYISLGDDAIFYNGTAQKES